MATGINRIHILGLPIDMLNGSTLAEAVKKLCRVEDHRQIVLLNFHEMTRALHNEERRNALRQAALVIPTSSLIVSAAHFLGCDTSPPWRPYPFVIRLLSILEEMNRTIYLLGSSMVDLRRVESMLQTTFPGLRIVGRYESGFPAGREDDVITAIKKSSPTLLLTGKGLKGQHLWIFRNRKRFSPGMGVWEKTCFNVFAGRRSKPNNRGSVRFIRLVLGTLVRPWRLLRMFRYALFYLLLLRERLRQRGGRRTA